MYAVYDRTFGDFLAETTVCTPYIYGSGQPFYVTRGRVTLLWGGGKRVENLVEYDVRSLTRGRVHLIACVEQADWGFGRVRCALC